MSESESTTTAVDFVIRSQVVGAPSAVANYREALEWLASIMAVQAEDGLWSLGQEEAENDDGPSKLIANITSTRFAVLIDGVDELTKGRDMQTEQQPAQQREAWNKADAHFRKLAEERADEGTSVQLACLVLAQYCLHQWSGDYGSPSEEMIGLAENTVGEEIDEVFASMMKDPT